MSLRERCPVDAVCVADKNRGISYLGIECAAVSSSTSVGRPEEAANSREIGRTTGEDFNLQASIRPIVSFSTYFPNRHFPGHGAMIICAGIYRISGFLGGTVLSKFLPLSLRRDSGSSSRCPSRVGPGMSRDSAIHPYSGKRL